MSASLQHSVELQEQERYIIYETNDSHKEYKIKLLVTKGQPFTDGLTDSSTTLPGDIQHAPTWIDSKLDNKRDRKAFGSNTDF